MVQDEFSLSLKVEVESGAVVLVANMVNAAVFTLMVRVNEIFGNKMKCKLID